MHKLLRRNTRNFSVLSLVGRQLEKCFVSKSGEMIIYFNFILVKMFSQWNKRLKNCLRFRTDAAGLRWRSRHWSVVILCKNGNLDREPETQFMISRLHWKATVVRHHSFQSRTCDRWKHCASFINPRCWMFHHLLWLSMLRETICFAFQSQPRYFSSSQDFSASTLESFVFSTRNEPVGLGISSRAKHEQQIKILINKIRFCIQSENKGGEKSSLWKKIKWFCKWEKITSGE